MNNIRYSSENKDYILKLSGQVVTAEEAVNFAKNDVHREIFFAERSEELNNTLILYRWEFRCPVCGKLQYVHGINNDTKKTRVMFENWALQSQMFFLQNNQNFLFSEWRVPSGSSKCDCCGNKGNLTNGIEERKLIASDMQISVRYYSDTKVKLLPEKECSLINFRPNEKEAPEGEAVIFCIESGHTYLSKPKAEEDISVIRSENDIPVNGLEDITYNANRNAISKILLSDQKLKIAIDNLFQEYFADNYFNGIGILTLNDFIMRNRFRGYPQSFYYGVPRLGEGAFSDSEKNKSFEQIPLSYADVVSYYKKLNLPNKKKSIKTFCFHPELFFYMEGYNLLPFNNYDIRMKICNSAEGLYLLSLLSQYPGIVEFIKELINIRGESTSWNILSPDISMLFTVASLWMQVSFSIEANEILSINGLWNIRQGLVQLVENSVPVPFIYTEKQLSLECEIGRYRFVLPRSVRMLEMAAHNLENCLADYKIQLLMRETTIILVADKLGKAVAAIEVNIKSKIVLQAYGRGNSALTEGGKSICKAVKQWCDTYNFVYEEEAARDEDFPQIPDDNNDELPF